MCVLAAEQGTTKLCTHQAKPMSCQRSWRCVQPAELSLTACAGFDKAGKKRKEKREGKKEEKREEKKRKRKGREREEKWEEKGKRKRKERENEEKRKMKKKVRKQLQLTTFRLCSFYGLNHVALNPLTFNSFRRGFWIFTWSTNT